MYVMQVIVYKYVPERKFIIHKIKIQNSQGEKCSHEMTHKNLKSRERIGDGEESRLKIKLLAIEKTLKLSHMEESANKEALVIDNIK